MIYFPILYCFLPTLIYHLWAVIRVERTKRVKVERDQIRGIKEEITKEKGGNAALEYCAEEGGTEKLKASGNTPVLLPFISTRKHLTMTHS